MDRLGWLGVVLLAASCTEAPLQLSEDAGATLARAKLAHVSGKVLVKRSNGDEWIDAVEAMDLYENDKVRTTAGGKTSIAFATGGSVALGEDALIAIAETRTRPGLERSDVTVLRGRVDAELPDAKHQSLSVTTPSATVRAGREIVFPMIFAAFSLASFLTLAAPQADQAAAQKALESARSALSRVDPASPARARAEQRLGEAVEDLKGGRYDAAKEKADEAWQFLSRDPSAASFTVQVHDGGTAVTNRGKEPISVDNGRGKAQVLASGATWTVPDAQAVARALPPPALLAPAERQQLKLKQTDKGLGPVTLTWTPVSGAKEYEVEYQVENGKPSLLKVQRAEAKLPPLPRGKVLWAVRTVGEEARSELSSRRWFDLQPDQVSLEVRPGVWK